MLKAWRVFLGTALSTHLVWASAEPGSLLADGQAPQTPPSAVEASPSAFPRSTFELPAITNIDEIAKQLKLSSFKGQKFNRKLKVAVLDNGFNGGLEGAIGKTLPKETLYHNGVASNADREEVTEFHGLFMAQLLAQLITASGAQADYELHLFNAAGYTKFADAVDKVVQQKFDIVLYAQVWEFGGNGDGKGFINALVSKAVDAGIVWINAAGNFGRLTRKAPVEGKVESTSAGSVEWVQFKSGRNRAVDHVKIKCAAPRGETCKLRLVLAWNDFKEDSEAGTDKDLDLFVVDQKGAVTASSELNQGLVKNPADRLASIVPRELIQADIQPGDYKVKVKIKSKNFTASRDELRITMKGPHLVMDSPSVGETLLPPADHPGVIVIGASDDVQSSQSKALKRPDLSLYSLVKLKDGSSAYSTSNASAIAAALVTLHLGTGTEKNRAAVIDKLKGANVAVASSSATPPRRQGQVRPQRPAAVAASRPTVRESERPYRVPENRVRRFSEARLPARQVCLRSLPSDGLYYEAMRLVDAGAVLQRSSGRYVLYVDPELLSQIHRSLPMPEAAMMYDDELLMFVTPRGFRFVTEDQAYGLGSRAIEVLPTHRPLCP